MVIEALIGDQEQNSAGYLCRWLLPDMQADEEVRKSLLSIRELHFIAESVVNVVRQWSD